MEGVVFGIDIGTTKVCALVGEIRQGQVHIIGLGQEPARGMRKGMIVDVAEATVAIAQAVAKAEQTSGYDLSRAFVSMAVNYATAARGGCHLEALSYWNGYGLVLPDLGLPEPLPHHQSDERQVKMAFDFQNYLGVFNPLGICKFIVKGGIGPERLCELVNATLGWNWTPPEVMTVGARLFQLKRLINLDLGVTSADDTLPARLLTHARPTGEAAGVLPDLEQMLPVYYQLRDWDGDGRPSTERLKHLGLA